MAEKKFRVAVDVAALGRGTQNLGVLGVYARKVTGGALTTIAKPPSDGSGNISEVPVLYHGIVYLQTATDLTTATGTLLGYASLAARGANATCPGRVLPWFAGATRLSGGR